MKRILISLVTLAVATTINAQVWIGGSLSFNNTHVNGTEGTSRTFGISPEVGVNLNEHLAVAVALAFSHSNPSSGYNTNTYAVGPYVRYSFFKAGDFSAFVDGGVSYANSHYQHHDKNGNAFGASIIPGIAYAVSEKVGLVAHLGNGLYWNHSWVKDGNHTNNYGFDLTNGISFGAYYNF